MNAGRRVLEPTLVQQVARVAAQARRVVPVCTGSFALAAAGLLDDRHAATHWRRGTDYNILMIARIKEGVADGKPMPEAVRDAVRHAGPSVAAAGIILAASFAILMLSSYVSQIGFAVAAGVLISMFLSSWLYVPALSTLLGRRIWWPAKSRRVVKTEPMPHAVDELQPAGR